MHDGYIAGIPEARGTVSSETGLADVFDLVTYARRHRYRMRNLHDGGPVPPARRMKSQGETTPTAQVGYVGKDDRSDPIVGYGGSPRMCHTRDRVGSLSGERLRADKLGTITHFRRLRVL